LCLNYNDIFEPAITHKAAPQPLVQHSDYEKERHLPAQATLHQVFGKPAPPSLTQQNLHLAVGHTGTPASGQKQGITELLAKQAAQLEATKKQNAELQQKLELQKQQHNTKSLQQQQQAQLLAQQQQQAEANQTAEMLAQQQAQVLAQQQQQAEANQQAEMLAQQQAELLAQQQQQAGTQIEADAEQKATVGVWH